LEFWNGLSFGDHDNDYPLVKFAGRLLSISVNSASCERLFSIFGTTLTKVRNCLSDQTLKSLAELKMFVRDEHRESAAARTRIKRQFVEVPLETASSAPPVCVTGGVASFSSALATESCSESFTTDSNSVLNTILQIKVVV
jgi:hypothetical protein